MEIKDIKANQGNIDLVVEIVSKEEPRSFEKFGKEGRVCNVKVRDATGEVKMTLWNDDIDQVSVGDKVHLQNGWCSEFRGEKQLSSGKFGKIEVVGKSEEAPVVMTNDPAMLQQEAGMMSDEEDDTELVDEEEFVE